MTPTEQLFLDFCRLYHRSESDVLSEAIAQYFGKPGRIRPDVLSKDDITKAISEFLDNRRTLAVNLYQPCSRR